MHPQAFTRRPSSSIAATSAAGSRFFGFLVASLLALLLASGCTTGSESPEQADADQGAQESDDGMASEQSGAGDGENATPSDRDLVAEYGPVFVEGPCAFTEPADTAPLCGTVTVPADWTDPNGGPTIEMPFAIFPGPSEGEGGSPDPVVYLEGGPGSHTLETLAFSYDLLFRPLTESRDVIVFDQRGAGESEPKVDCPETEDVSLYLADHPETSDEETLELSLEAVAACQERLSDIGIDLNNYDTVQNARDVEALRVALGYDSWNLFGISYGTRLGLEVLHRFGETVRAAVLDSVYPPNADAVAENPGSFVDSFDAVAAACDAEAACSEPGPFAERVQALVVQLEAAPLAATVENWLTGELDDVLIDGQTLEGIVLQALYNPSGFTDLPEVVTELEAGEVGAAEVFLSQSRTNDAFFSEGMFFALTCRDEVAFADRAEVDAAVPQSPFRPGEPFDVAINAGPTAFELCDTLDLEPADDATTEAVVSDVPTLLMAGRFDPVTPVEWAELALETLSAGQLVVAPSAAHAVSADPCGLSIVGSFLDAPNSAPDSSCLDDDVIQFIGMPNGPIELETVVRANGAGGQPVSIVQPARWDSGALEGHLVRGASTLDSAQIFQIIDSPMMAPIVTGFVEDSEGVTLGPQAPFGPGDRVGSLDGAELDFGWSRQSVATDEVVVEFFERPLDRSTVLIGLVAPADEADRLVEQVLIPALRGFAVEPA